MILETLLVQFQPLETSNSQTLTLNLDPVLLLRYAQFKGTVSVISSDPPQRYP